MNIAVLHRRAHDLGVEVVMGGEEGKSWWWKRGRCTEWGQVHNAVQGRLQIACLLLIADCHTGKRDWRETPKPKAKATPCQPDRPPVPYELPTSFAPSLASSANGENAKLLPGIINREPRYLCTSGIRQYIIQYKECEGPDLSINNLYDISMYLSSYDNDHDT